MAYARTQWLVKTTSQEVRHNTLKGALREARARVLHRMQRVEVFKRVTTIVPARRTR